MNKILKNKSENASKVIWSQVCLIQHYSNYTNDIYVCS